MNKRTLIPIAACIFLSMCREQENNWSFIPPSQSGVSFANTLVEDESNNIIEYLYFYNGAGVAAGDINNDGLTDLFFVSNQGSNVLYLNKGNLKFKDITQSSGIKSKRKWETGVTMADINGDGFLDIYVCGVGGYRHFNGRNQLYLNNGDLTFTEQAAEFGIDFTGFSTHASFFDYDNDGDLDMYLLNHSVHTPRSYAPGDVRLLSDSLSGDKLYKNQLVESGKVLFEDVTKQAGILNSHIGYGLGVAVADVNWDGFADLYIGNDFHENDYLYINNGDGTFKEIIRNATTHTSRFSMGNDIADFNNDLWPDIVAVDMQPRNEQVRKRSAGEDAYDIFNFKLKYGYHAQVARNTLQLNAGMHQGTPLFSEMAYLAGIASTDWSWAPLFADFNNDGFKDLYITNGIVRRPNDMDYISYIAHDSVQLSLQVFDKNDLEILKKMPEGKESNFLFLNRSNYTFQDITHTAGLFRPSFSNGATYADLDNDGDLDLVVNNINEPAHIIRNNTGRQQGNYLAVSLHGPAGNTFGVGAKVILFTGGARQLQHLMPARGWCSSVDGRLHFGVGSHALIDSVMVIWPGNRMQILKSVTANQQVTIDYSNNNRAFTNNVLFGNQQFLLTAVTPVPDYRHVENEYNAFASETLIPHMLSEQGPPSAVGDVNGDGLDDFFIGGGRGQSGALYIQKTNASFTHSDQPAFLADVSDEDTAAAFADVDGDGDPDLIVAAGGQETNQQLIPRLYINEKGRFARHTFPPVSINASCIKPADFDNDGDVDLFIGSNVIPGLYGMSPLSFLFNNDGSGNFSVNQTWLAHANFDNVTRVRPGMVKDADWTDINGDGLPDLMLLGEWMPVTLLIQQPNHTFVNKTEAYGLAGTSGLWNAMLATDLDNDGDVDFVCGNLGLNSRLTASTSKPLQMLLGDFDANQSSDHILIYYNGDSAYVFPTRDQLIKQLPFLKKRLLKYKDFSTIQVENLLSAEQLANGSKLQVTELSSVVLENTGGKFIVRPLPIEAQMFPVCAIEADDLDDDGILDILLAGNQSAVQPEIGPHDAGLGLVLKGIGGCQFQSIAPHTSGFFVTGEVRSSGILRSNENQYLYLFGRNGNSLVIFKRKPAD
ncbi:MAG: VCBS repeat-containing protein [Flammeovirgaceae bacterium]|nr:MAG: VCBS repeat-containing protein [Flammeovirgaceae bacterium]